MESQQPTITQEQRKNIPVDEFIVKVKLLSNQVYEFTIDPQNSKVSDLKKMILEKINVPLQRQRIVFGGKQLIDDHKITQYVKQSGMTVHLIAKTGAQQQPTTSTTTNQQSNTSTSNQNNQQQGSNQGTRPQQQSGNVPPNPFANLMSMFGGMNGPQSGSMTITNVGGGLGSSGLEGILGSLGIRIPNQPPSSNQPQNTQPRSSTTQPPTNDPFVTPPNRRQQSQQQPQQQTSLFSFPNISTTTSTLNQPLFTQPSNQSNNIQQTTSNLPQQSSTQPHTFNVSNQPILTLNQVISTLNLPSEPVLDNRHMSLRQQTAQYLRRLQHQYMRMIPQLNRSVQLLNEGRVSHMSEVLRLFQAMRQANRHAQEAIRRLINLPVNVGQQQQQGQQQNNADLMDEEPSEQGPLHTGNVQATIIIQQDDILDADIDQQPTNYNNLPNNTQQQQGPRVLNSGTTTINLGNLGANGLGGLSSLLGSLTGQQFNMPTNNTNQQQQANQQATNPQQQQNLGGLNLGNLMSMFGGAGNMSFSSSTNQQQQQPRQPQQQQPVQQPSQSTSTSNPQQQPQFNLGNLGNLGNIASMLFTPPPTSTQNTQQPSTQQQPQFNLGNLGNIASMLFTPPPTSTQNTQQPSTQQQPSTSTSTSSQQPLGGGGMNLMGIFSSLQQSGGMGQLMSMSLGQMLQEGTQHPTIYSTIFRSFTGGDLLNCFTTKNFDFLDRKYNEIRENFMQAIALAESQEDMIKKITEDITRLIVPRENVRNERECRERVEQIVRRGVEEVVRLTRDRGDVKYSQKVLLILKNAFCQSISIITSYVETQRLVNNETAQQFVFGNLKLNSVALMDQFIQGLSSMFYGFIQRDLLRVYTQYKQQNQRKQQRTIQQVANQQQLIKQIEQESKKDIEYLKNFKHSQYYHPKNKEDEQE